MSIKRFLKKLRFWRKPSPPQTIALFRLLQNQLYLGQVVSRSEWAAIFRTIANEMERQIVQDAGAPIGVWFTESPIDWLKREAARAENRL